MWGAPFFWHIYYACEITNRGDETNRETIARSCY